MENKKNNKGAIIILAVISFVLLCSLAYVLFGREDKNSGEPITNDGTTTKVIEKTTDELYNEYLINLKKEITSKYLSYSNNVINGSSMLLDTSFEFTVKKNLDLVFTTGDKKYNSYKVSENVLNMFLIDVGNGGYKYLYFVKTDGSLNKMCIDCLYEDSTVKVEKTDHKYIVNVAQGLFDYEFSGAPGAILIDIKGNIVME